MSRKKQIKRLDWAKFTDFRYRRTREDLIKTCEGYKRSELTEIFNTPDATGLQPIHWAAVHNRSDLIDFMVDNGSQILSSCNNKLFAQGTALHLAAINGSIEAANMLLHKCDQMDRNQTDFKTLELSQPPASADNTVADNGRSTVPTQINENKKNRSMAETLMNSRDFEGQTALMRSAAPRSKRLNIIRDLLRKNFWSLNGRPAEMALFLIIRGSDWRDTDTQLGMNLLHLAIVNGYDDIVNMLLVLDKNLLDVPAKFRRTESRTSGAKASVKSSSDGMESINLTTTSSPSISPISSIETGSTVQSDTSSYQPLVNKRDKLNDLLSTGVTPLQLSIIYGRVSMISLLWCATKNHQKGSSGGTDQENSAIISEKGYGELRAIIFQAFLTNRAELLRFIRSAMLKTLLVLDISVLVVIWMPVYFSSVHEDDPGEKIISNLAGGIFLVSFLITLMLAFRVMLRNPGYLKRETVSYHREMSALVGYRPKQGPADDLSAQHKPRYLETKLNLLERIKLLCHKCRCIRRPRSWHCNYCDHCVQDFDHHCIYLGCCIGHRNRLDFLLMMIALTITSIYGTIIQASSLSREQWKDFGHVLGFIWIFKYAMIGASSAFFIIRRACLGVTMFEMIRSNRIRNVFGPNGPPPEISRSHSIYTTSKGSFWRYSPDRYLTGDLPLRKVLSNFKEFINRTTISDYFLAIACSDSQLTRSTTIDPTYLETKIELA